VVDPIEEDRSSLNESTFTHPIHLLGDLPIEAHLNTLFDMIPQTIADFAERARQLEALARPTPEDTPFFNHCMALAKSMGMTWEQALRYVVECRNGIKR